MRAELTELVTANGKAEALAMGLITLFQAQEACKVVGRQHLAELIHQLGYSVIHEHYQEHNAIITKALDAMNVKRQEPKRPTPESVTDKLSLAADIILDLELALAAFSYIGPPVVVEVLDKALARIREVMDPKAITVIDNSMRRAVTGFIADSGM